MIGRIERTTGPAEFDFGDAHKLPEHLEGKELFKEPSWLIAMEVLRDSFVISSGRQYAQLCDMAVAAALVQEYEFEFDRTIFKEPDAIEAIGLWELPPGHTGKPNHTPGLVEGGHEFWWLMLEDAFAWRFDESAQFLPNESAIIKRFRECGVKRGQTSINSTEETMALDGAVDDLRGAKGESSDQLAMRALKWHLRVGLHWLSHKRPRPGSKDIKDVHEEGWRSGMLAAVDTPESERTLFDQVLVAEARALDRLLAMTPEEIAASSLEDTYDLYCEVLELHNKVHSTERLVALHRRDTIETTDARPTAPTLGAVGLIAMGGAE